MAEKDRHVHPFDPDWVVPTAEVLREWLDENGLTPATAAACLGKDRKQYGRKVIEDILDRDGLVTHRNAAILQVVTGVAAKFWVAFEQNYRAGLAAGKGIL